MNATARWVPEYLTIKQAGAHVGVSRRTIYNWLDANKIEYVRTPGGSVRIVATSLYRVGNITPRREYAEQMP